MNEFWLQMIESIKSMGSPMRPEAAEIAFIESHIETCQAASNHTNARALLLGVTREVTMMRWPDEVFLEAVDRSQPMIDAFWAGDVPGHRKLTVNDWWNLDDSNGRYRYAIGDGVFNIQPYPEGYEGLAEHLHGIMDPGGLGFFRVFSRPEGDWSEGNFLEQYRAGAYHTFQELRFCFAIARQASVELGAELNIPMVIDALAHHGISESELRKLPDFRSVAEPMLNQDHAHTLKLHYPSREEFTEAVDPWFEVRDVGFGDHPLANLCPTYCLLRKPG